jgi:hypothetical protein
MMAPFFGRLFHALTAQERELNESRVLDESAKRARLKRFLRAIEWLQRKLDKVD